MTKNENIDATFCIEDEDLGNWVVSLMEEFIENDDLTIISLVLFQKILNLVTNRQRLLPACQ